MMMSTEVDQTTLAIVQDLIRKNLIGRDSLYAAADKLGQPALQNVCRRLADELGGHVADLEQFLLARHQQPISPDDEVVVRKLKGVVLEVLEQQGSEEEVMAGSEECEEVLKKEYDRAIEKTKDESIKDLLHKQRQEVEAGEELLEAEIQRTSAELPPQKRGRDTQESTMISRRPQVGEIYRCKKCGMQIEVILPCNSLEGEPDFRCCGAGMTITDPSGGSGQSHARSGTR